MSVENLSKARKAKQRAERGRQADANAVKFGRTKAQKQAEEKAVQDADAKLDGHRAE